MLDNRKHNPLLFVVKGHGMGKKPATKLLTVGVRFSPDEKVALEKHAADEQRPASVMLRKIVVDYLKGKGLLK